MELKIFICRPVWRGSKVTYSLFLNCMQFLFRGKVVYNWNSLTPANSDRISHRGVQWKLKWTYPAYMVVYLLNQYTKEFKLHNLYPEWYFVKEPAWAGRASGSARYFYTLWRLAALYVYNNKIKLQVCLNFFASWSNISLIFCMISQILLSIVVPWINCGVISFFLCRNIVPWVLSA